MARAKRVIYVSSIEDFESANVGLHFTKNMNYSHTGGGYNGCTKKLKFKIEIRINGTFEINQECTEISNENYPHEKEVVLEPNQELSAIIEILDTEKNSIISKKKQQINTGDRCDLWVRNIIF